MAIQELLSSPVYLVAQFFGICSMIISIGSQQLKLRGKILIAFIFANIFNAVHFYLLGAISGVALAIIGAFRFGIAIKSTSKIWLYIFLIINTLAAYFTFENIILTGTSYLAATFIVLSSFITKDSQMRIAIILGGLGWLVYGILIGSIIAIIANTLFLSSSIIGWYRHSYKIQKHI
jgi:hypothetical protein